MGQTENDTGCPVCQDFRAAALAPAFWPADPPLELHWRLGPSGPVSSLLRSWAPCVEAVCLTAAPRYGPPSASLQPKEPGGQRLVSIRDQSHEEHNPELFMTCLDLVPQLGPVASLIIHCVALSSAEVQLLAGLHMGRLYLACHSGFSLDALPAAGSTLVRFWAEDFNQWRCKLLER